MKTWARIFGVVVVAGLGACAKSTTDGKRVVEFSAGPEVVEDLRRCGGRFERTAAGVRVEVNGGTRAALGKALLVAETRVGCAEMNIANAGVPVRTGGSGGYRRREVVVGADGETTVVEASGGRVRKEYLPGNPDADAGGYVAYSVVDVAGEQQRLLEAQRERQAVGEALRGRAAR